MSANAEAPPGPEVWRAQNLRLIAFPTQPQFAAAQHWWRDLTGVEPENVVERRQRQEKEESGSFEAASLSLGLDLLRIQWTVAPRLDVEVALGEQPPTLGLFMDRKDWFRGLMERWLPDCPPIHRLAFTASLLQPVADYQTGHRLLDRYLRWVQVDANSSEFLYRINRRMPSRTGIQGLAINRLSTWLVAKFAVVARVIQGGHPQQQFQPAENFACALELDVNTVPEFQGPLPHEELGRIFMELIQAGEEIARRGDPVP